jgi:hypothetical protein
MNIVFRPFLDFMDSFKLSKAHNMFALMLDPYFKDLSLMGDSVGQFLAIEIVSAYENQFLFPTLKSLYQKFHGRLNACTSVVQNIMCNTNVIFGIGVSKDDTCFEQIILFFYLFEKHCEFFFGLQFAHFKLIYLGIMCVNVVLT